MISLFLACFMCQTTTDAPIYSEEMIMGGFKSQTELEERIEVAKDLARVNPNIQIVNVEYCGEDISRNAICTYNAVITFHTREVEKYALKLMVEADKQHSKKVSK